MTNKKIIIGLIGEMAAGKTTATDYLNEKYKAVSFKFSDMLRDVLKRMYLPNSRENMQTLSTALRQNFSEDIMSKVLTEDVKQADRNFIITEGIRRPSDITYLKQLDNFILIYIKANEKLRYERLIQRSENPDDQNKTWEGFQQEGQQEPEQKIQEVAKAANHIVDNNGDIDNLYKQIDEIVERYK